LRGLIALSVICNERQFMVSLHHVNDSLAWLQSYSKHPAERMKTEKQPLLLVPGLLCNGRLWHHQIEHLGDLAAMSVADLSQDETIPDMASRALATAPKTFSMAALSMGGYVAQEIMRQAPERITRLALLDTSARADTDDQFERRAALIKQVEKVAPAWFSGVTKRLLPMLIHPDRQHDDDLVGVIKEMAKTIGRDGYIRQQRAIMNRPDGVADLTAISCPTLVLCGRQDVLTPIKVHEEMADNIPDARLVVVEDCGHLAPLEQPHAVTAVLRYWLSGVN